MKKLILLALGACAGPAKAPPPVPEVPLAPDAAVVRAPAPLRLPGDGAPPAPWLEAPLADELPDPSAGSIIALGSTAAVIRTTAAGWFAASTSSGAHGPLQVPAGTRWVGLGGKGDQVFAAVDDGTLYRAADVATAAASGFQSIGKVAGATEWAAAESIVAAAAGDQVFVSKDGGVKFKATRVAAGFVPEELFARMDGVLLVQGKVGDAPVSYVSTYGKKWKRSSLQASALEQRGSWIEAPCAGAVMAWGSTEWIAVPDVAGLDSLDMMLDHSRIGEIEPQRDWETAVSWRPPKFDKAKQVTGTFDSGCSRDATATGHVGKVTRGFRGDEHPLVVIAGQAGEAPPPTRTSLELTHDGACPGSPHEACSGPPTRWPHAIALDREAKTAQILSPPAGCRPGDTFSVRGLRVLACDDGGGTALHALVDGAWQPEGALSAPVGELAGLNVASDGTVAVFHGCPDDRCSVWVRSPLPLGRGAWRDVEVPGARVMRVLPGGAVLGLVEDTGDGTRVSVVIAEPDEEPRVLVSGVALHTIVKTIEIVDGTLQIDFDDKTSRTVADDGSLL